MQNNQLEGFLIVGADRFPFIQEELGSTVELIKEFINENGRPCVQFHFKLTHALDALNLFHAGVKCGCKEMMH